MPRKQGKEHFSLAYITFDLNSGRGVRYWPSIFNQENGPELQPAHVQGSQDHNCGGRWLPHNHITHLLLDSVWLKFKSLYIYHIIHPMNSVAWNMYLFTCVSFHHCFSHKQNKLLVSSRSLKFFPPYSLLFNFLSTESAFQTLVCISNMLLSKPLFKTRSYEQKSYQKAFSVPMNELHYLIRPSSIPFFLLQPWLEMVYNVK